MRGLLYYFFQMFETYVYSSPRIPGENLKTGFLQETRFLDTAFAIVFRQINVNVY
jgi:hypothetical protein